MASLTPLKPPILRFGPFDFDVRAGELRKYGIRIKLREQPIQILELLLAKPGEVILREEIRQRLWPDNTTVGFDQAINAAILRLRSALGESAERPKYIETVARRGYRFKGEIEYVGAVQAAAPNPAQPVDSLPSAKTERHGQRAVWIAAQLLIAGMWIISQGGRPASKPSRVVPLTSYQCEEVSRAFRQTGDKWRSPGVAQNVRTGIST